MIQSFWQRVTVTSGAIALVGVSSLVWAKAANALTFNSASEGGGLLVGTYGATLQTNGADNYTDLSTFVNVPTFTLDAIAGGEVFGGSAVSQTFSATLGGTLSFSWSFTGTPAPGFSDTAFIALSGPFGVQKLADTLSSVKSGFFSYTFPSTGTYSLRFGIMDVGDNSGVSQLQVFNGRVRATAIPTPALLPALLGMGLGVWSGHRSKDRQQPG